MRSFSVAACLLLLAVAATAQNLPGNVEKVETFGDFTQYKLKSNDMTILLAPNNASPVFTFMVVYHVGSRNEAPGNTGSAHLLEHLLFNKSTENFGKAKGHKTFQEVLNEAGADFSSTNMTTWYDRMNGYSTLPSGKLELAMRIEADRLGRALILDSERQSEMSVVRNEYEIGENNPWQVLRKATVGAAIVAHPYHWYTIGYRSDIEGVTTEKLREHYRTFFWPNNAEAILVGDFDVEKALQLFDKHFGAFGRSPQAIPPVVTIEPPQEGERRVVVERPGAVGMVMLAYIRPGAAHSDFMALEVLSSILGRGVNSRLNRALVEQGVATNVNVNNYALRDPFPLLIDATPAPSKSHQDVENAIKAAIAEVVAKGVTEKEVQRAQRQIEVDVIRSRDGTFNLANNLGEAVASTNWKWFVTYVDNVNAVTADDVKRVATTYLVPEHATVGWYVAAANAKKAETSAAAPTSSVRPAASTPQASSASDLRRATGTFAQRTTRRVLKNGITVDIVENHAVPTVAIRALVFAGETSAPAGKPMLPALMAKMLPRGTATRTKEQIGAMLDDAGATRSYSVETTQVFGSVDGIARDLPLLLDVLSDELKNPAYRDDELVKAKKELQNEVLREDDSTTARAMERLRQLVYANDHPYYKPMKDQRLASVNAATADDLRAFHRARYNGASLIVTIVGDVDAAKTLSLVEKYFGDIPKGARHSANVARTAPRDEPSREALTMRRKANMNLLMGTASGLRRNDPDFEASLIANGVLGHNVLSSRIGRRVRDAEGLSYGVYSRFGFSEEVDGMWYVNVNVAPQNLAKAMKSTTEEIERFAREGASDAEIEAQKSFFAGNYQVSLGSNAGVASALATAEKFGYGPKYLDEFPQRVRRVTKEQVNEAVRKHLPANKLHVVVAGDLEKLPE